MDLKQIKHLEYLPGFDWAVGPFFSETLKACHFESSGVYYSDRSAYDPWPGKDRPFEFFQVTQSDGSASLSFPENWKRPVTIQFFSRDGTNRYIDTSQGALYELIWNGSLETLDPDHEVGAIPLGLGADLRRHIDWSLIKEDEILVPIDLAHQASIWKLRSMANSLNQDNPALLPAGTYFPGERVKPTVLFAVLNVGEKGLVHDTELIRQAISPESVQFNLGVHAFFQRDRE